MLGTPHPSSALSEDYFNLPQYIPPTLIAPATGPSLPATLITVPSTNVRYPADRSALCDDYFVSTSQHVIDRLMEKAAPSGPGDEPSSKRPRRATEGHPLTREHTAPPLGTTEPMGHDDPPRVQPAPRPERE